MADHVVSIIGCGWIGLPLADKLLDGGFSVKGSTTTSEKIALLQEKGINAYQLELNPEPSIDLTNLLQADTIIIDIPPKAGKHGDHFHPQQLRHLTEAIRRSPAQHVVYVSSTSVYPDLNRTVTEEDVVLPEASAAAGLVQAEQLVLSLSPDKIVTVIRCGGLLGYDRIPGKYVAGKTVNTGAVPVNYLHRDDAVGILAAVIQRPLGGTYNAVAPNHPPREAVYRKNCIDFGFDLPVFVIPEESVPFKVISPAKLLQSLSYTFKYPEPLQFFYKLRA